MRYVGEKKIIIIKRFIQGSEIHQQTIGDKHLSILGAQFTKKREFTKVYLDFTQMMANTESDLNVYIICLND